MSVSFAALDFETANYDECSACAVGLVRVVDGVIVCREKRLINPDTYFLADFTDNVHGISAENVVGVPLFDEVWGGVEHLLDGVDFIAAHRASFDRGVLYKCCEKFGLEVPDQRFVCTLKLARKVWKLPAYGLNKVCEHLGIELNHHDALSDAMGCAQIVLRGIKEGCDVSVL